MSIGLLRKNSRYPELPQVRNIGATCVADKYTFCKGPLYSHIGNEDALSFLNFPENYLPVFSVLLKNLVQPR